MRWSDLDALREPRGYPAVSILATLQTDRPGNPEDPLRLRHLADEARRRLHDELGTRAGEVTARQLDDAVAALDLRQPSPGVAIFVAPGESHVLELAFPVPERVVIDETFATRDLVRGLASTPAYRVLALGQKSTRVFEGSGRAMVEHDGDGFPAAAEGTHGEPLASGGYVTHTARPDEQVRSFLRQVDAALARVHGRRPLPLVVAGTERDLTNFGEITTLADSMIGTLAGNHATTAPSELARLAAPLVERHVAAGQAEAIEAMVEGIGSGRTVVGIKATWDAAIEGRGRTLLVEEDFDYPARTVDRRLEPAGDPGAPGVVDDAVDELIEVVLDRGGDVVITAPGALGVHGPVALLLRY